MYDPQLARWHAVDQLAEKYYDYSPYCYVGNNPIMRIDPDGRYWDTEEDKNTAKQQSQQLQARDQSLAKQETKLNSKISAVNSDTKLTATKKQAKVDKLNDKLSDVTDMRTDVQSAQTELTSMGNDTKTAFAFNNLGSDASEGYISHDKNSKGDLRITVNYAGSFENRAHEMKHGYQVLTGDMKPSGADPKNFEFAKTTHPHVLESQAYQRQYAVGGQLPSSAAGSVNRMSDINRGWVSVVYYFNASGNKVFPYLSTKYK